jgi:Holliday junction resolvase RusA-like endonuclease
MFKSREVPRKGQKSLPFATPMQRARRTPAVVGAAGAWLAIRVPTVGLHHKGRMVGKQFCPHADKPELADAKKLYATALPLIPAPIAGPLRLHVDFVLEPSGNMEPFEGVLPYTGKPDRSNLVKVFEDALRRQGWMRDDAEVVTTPGGKWVSFDRERQGVWVILSTILQVESYRFDNNLLGASRVPSKAYVVPNPGFVVTPHR